MLFKKLVIVAIKSFFALYGHLLGEEHEEMVVVAALEDRLGGVCVELNHLNIQR